MNEISSVPSPGQLLLLPDVVSSEDAIGDLPIIKPGEDGSNLEYRYPPRNSYQKLMRGIISIDEYLASYSIT